VTVGVVEPPAGEVAEVDFGLLGLWSDPATGRRHRVYGFLVTLGYSRYAFLPSSTAWKRREFFGGVPRRLVVDSLKAVVTRTDRYAPTIARVFLEYAQYRGFVVDPAVPRHATGKPKVERGTPDLFLLHDFGLRKVTAQQSSDFYDVLVERHRRAATIITSNRAVDEWMAGPPVPRARRRASGEPANRPVLRARSRKDLIRPR
jgi:hypothetical protein